MKTIADHFSDWESHVFGFGYGTGEPHTIQALRTFFDACGNAPSHAYQYDKLESLLTPTVAWLLINALCHADIIEYGTSPRFGWMTTPYGKELFRFVTTHDVQTMIDLANRDQEYTPCYPDYCNCDDGPCQNPFWRARRT